MVKTNVRIIEELKSFLDMACINNELRELFVSSSTDFTRQRKLTFNRMVGMLINLPKRSLSIELQELFDMINLSSQLATKAAFTLQRSKLMPYFLETWNKLLVDCFYHYYGKNVKLWRGFRVQAVDGSTAYLIDRAEIVEKFGTQDNQHSKIPMARVMQLEDVLNKITIWGNISPIKESEGFIISKHIGELHEDSLTLFDRGYPSYLLMYLMLNQEKPRNFVIRCKADFNKQVKEFVASNQDSKIVMLTPSSQTISRLKNYGYIVNTTTQIKVRLVKVILSSDQVEILLTSLYDEQDFVLKDFKYLYGLRWNIETTYGIQKNQQQMEQFSGHRVICIEQDYAAGIFVSNLQSLIEKQSELYLKQISKTRKYNYKINKNISWAYLKSNVIKLILENDSEKILTELQNSFQKNLEPIRPGRKYERHRHMKRAKGKYQTLTNYRRAI